MNMFARFDENPAMTLQDIKETKRYGRTDVKTIPTTNKICRGYKNKVCERVNLYPANNCCPDKTFMLNSISPANKH